MHRTLRRTIAVSAAVALPLGLAGVAAAAEDPVPDFTKIDVTTALQGAAFVESADVSGDVRPELVASAFGSYFGPAPAGPGTVTMYSNAARVPTPGHAINSWTERTIVPTTAGIYGPNDPTLTDVDGDGDVDVIVPAGNFFRSFVVQSPPFAGVGSGTLTWWEQRSNGATWIRHDIVTAQDQLAFVSTPTAVNTAAAGPPNYQLIGSTQRNYSYHGVQHADIDNDGIKDLVTVGEDAGNPGTPIDDIVTLQYFKGLGGGDFGPAVDLGPGGGSLPYVADVDSDGKLDVVSAQYFGPVTCQGTSFPIATVCAPGAGASPSAASFVWFQQTGDATDGLTAADFTKRPIASLQGPSFQIKPVPNLRGTGVTWVGTNHTNKNVPFPPFVFHPEPAVYELTPGSDPTAAWTVQKLSTPNSFPVCSGPSPGQAAPGGFGAGDLDGDGDTDLAVSGDGSRYVYWLQQQSDGTFITRTMPGTNAPSPYNPTPPPPGCTGGFGQAGGNLVIDLNRDGKNEAVWGSFDANQVSIWAR